MHHPPLLLPVFISSISHDLEQCSIDYNIAFNFRCFRGLAILAIHGRNVIPHIERGIILFNKMFLEANVKCPENFALHT